MLPAFKKQTVDQRSAPRRPLRCKVRIIGPRGQAINGESFDLSTSGIGVILDAHLAVGDVCTVMFAPFTHGSVKSVSVTATIVFCMLNSAGFRTGFQFVNVPATTVGVIESIIG